MAADAYQGHVSYGCVPRCGDEPGLTLLRLTARRTTGHGSTRTSLVPLRGRTSTRARTARLHLRVLGKS
jgi:hypothetical protein